MNMHRHFLALFFLGSMLGAAPSQSVYSTVPVPAGKMTLQIPLDTYFENKYLAVPVEVTTGLRMGRYEVSNRQWDACFRASGCGRKAEMRDDEGLDNPVARVNWHDAAQFARWLSKSTGKRYRLPTEAEWYYVFSLGKGYKIETRSYDYSKLDEIGKIPKKTWKQGTFGSNAWGVADMLGNVWEWTLSCYTLSESRLLEKPDIEALETANACSTRVVGGENCAQVPDFIKDTFNGGCASVEPAANLGFRLVEEE